MSNLPTLEEFRRQQEALLRAGIIDQATFDRRMALAKQKLGAQPPPVDRYASGSSQRGPARPTTSPRVDDSRLISAPYRFVPIADGWVPCDLKSLVSQNVPDPEGWEAEIEIEIEAESPLLIGEEKSKGDDAAGDVVPMALAHETDWVIPGATLRGWLRSEMEIVAFARLDQTNHGRVFGLRDFDHAAFGEGRYPVGRVDSVRAGWLRRTAEGDHEIAPCPNWRVFEAKHLADLFGLRPGEDITRQSLLDKYRSVGMTRRGEGNDGKPVDILDLEAALRRPRVDMIPLGEINLKSAVMPKPASDGRIQRPRGHLVFSGRSPSGKRLEYWFEATGWTDEKGWGSFKWTPLSKDQWQRFEDINATLVGDRRKPQGSYEELEPTLETKDPVPIFYVGDPGGAHDCEEPGAPRFAFGLTRLFKVPHAYDLDDIIARSNHGLPKLLPEAERGKGPRMPIDFVENLFGFVHEPKRWGVPESPASPPRDFARRGRIAVGAARLVGSGGVRTTRPTDTVMSVAKPSFAPFYLVGTIKDYSDDKAKIAGRKVYPPRFDARAVDEGRTVVEVERLLKRQVEAIRRATAPNKPFNPKILTRLAFLDPGAKGTHPRFRARLRLHNVSAAEIGAVLWVVTHGGADNLRHMIGRAKGFGAGQVRVTVTALDLDPNSTAATKGLRLDDPLATRIGAFREAFEAHMEAAVKVLAGDRSTIGEWKTSPTIRGWLAARDPAAGARAASEGRLNTMALKEFEPNGKSLNPYKKIRDMTKPRKDGRPPTGRKSFFDFS